MASQDLGAKTFVELNNKAKDSIQWYLKASKDLSDIAQDLKTFTVSCQEHSNQVIADYKEILKDLNELIEVISSDDFVLEDNEKET